VQFEFNLESLGRPEVGETLTIGTRQMPMVLIRNRRARRYILRMDQRGRARVTIPGRGSTAEARRFAERNKAWLERQFQRLEALPRRSREWLAGTEILFRGELEKLEAGVNGEIGLIGFGGEIVRVSEPRADLRSAIERHLWRMAAKELPCRVLEFAAAHQFQVRRITIRNQRSRWGSCSRQGTISLNWRLIQAPAFVRDYIILHELMHLRQMNHSARFWREVERACPDYKIAERWLKQNSSLLRSV
jgi:predicted metal-dependent hydrolase